MTDRSHLKKNIKNKELKKLSLSPRQEKFVDYYFNPTNKKTFANGYQSALAAGYSKTYAEQILVDNPWLERAKQSIRRFEPEHIIQGIQIEATNYKDNKGSERLKAFELLAKMQGMLVEKSMVAHVNVEQAISELK